MSVRAFEGIKLVVGGGECKRKSACLVVCSYTFASAFFYERAHVCLLVLARVCSENKHSNRFVCLPTLHHFSNPIDPVLLLIEIRSVSE